MAIDRRSISGNKNPEIEGASRGPTPEEQAAGEAQRVQAGAMRQAMVGPAVHLDFENEMQFTMWRNALEIGGRQHAANAVKERLTQDVGEYHKLMVDMVSTMGLSLDRDTENRPVNYVGTINVLCAFLGLPAVEIAKVPE